MNNAHAAAPTLEPLPTEHPPMPPNVHAQAAPSPARPAGIVLTCDNCGYKLAVGSLYCPNCQAVFSGPHPAIPQAQAAPAEVAPPKAHVGQIIIMWVVTLLAWSAAASGGPEWSSF